ncbi:thiamine phosphate synthase [Bacillus piscicola]|uniref:thiamine phosphate synthase n=1 Tax=Bacillus piscicola TaxID=1632684 RepID=UPI001F08A656|nr:thiamine phosphate synthase [Bacillus piscicola]
MTATHFLNLESGFFGVVENVKRVADVTLHVISTGVQPLETWLEITKQVYPYVDYIHIREKAWPLTKIEAAAEQFLAAGMPAGKLILNSHPELAARLGLGGAHLPENAVVPPAQGSDVWGCSVHSVESAVQKAEAGADYLFYGHIFETKSKQGLASRGLRELREAAHSVRCPVIAIGGITPERTALCLENGAAGIAVMSGVYKAHDPLTRIQAYHAALHKGGSDE